MPEKLNLTGKQFGRLTALKEVGKNKHGNYLWLCRCDCGREKIIIGSSLVKGDSRSCGHHPRGRKKDERPHIQRISKIWYGMKDRCENPNSSAYRYYGARGIKICEEWQDKNVFYIWAINNGYKEHLTINRVDNNGNYKPSNCNWVTRKEQQNNRRGNVTITHNGETHTVQQWVDILGITRSGYKHRTRRGWNKESAIFTPRQDTIEPIDMAGQRYGRLTVLRYTGGSQKGRGGATWLCQCDCGEYVAVSRKKLKEGKKKSCGCLEFELTGVDRRGIIQQ